MDSISWQQAKEAGLTIFNPKIRQKVRIEFEDLTDEEAIAYIMCTLCKWSARRVARVIKRTHPTVMVLVRRAQDKRK